MKKAVVLGAGTMGAQIAAHLAGMGLDVCALDVKTPSLEPLRKKYGPTYLPAPVIAGVVVGAGLVVGLVLAKRDSD